MDRPCLRFWLNFWGLVAAASAAVATAAAVAAVLWLGTRFIDSQRSAFHFFAVHVGNSGLCFGLVAHLHKAEAFGAAGVTVHDDLGRHYATVRLKQSLQIIVANRIGQIAHVQLLAHEGLRKGTGEHTIIPQDDLLHDYVY